MSDAKLWVQIRDVADSIIEEGQRNGINFFDTDRIADQAIQLFRTTLQEIVPKPILEDFGNGLSIPDITIKGNYDSESGKTTPEVVTYDYKETKGYNAAIDTINANIKDILGGE